MGCDIRVLMIEGAKDPDEFIVKYGNARFKNVIDKAISIIEFKVKLLKKNLDLNNANDKIKFSNEIAKYLSKYNKNYTIIEDRSIAIKEAVEFVKASKDKYIILMLGKGNEKTQKVGNSLVPYKSDMINILECIDEYEKECIKK